MAEQEERPAAVVESKLVAPPKNVGHRDFAWWLAWSMFWLVVLGVLICAALLCLLEHSYQAGGSYL